MQNLAVIQRSLAALGMTPGDGAVSVAQGIAFGRGFL